ncbi:hypothetical protein B0I37DRAFT_371183, partial [Chaetomium sp. MPI-CAGE-AT-0009]
AASILDEPVDYRDLKEWIAEQERNPKPLTPLQQRAISDLRRSIEPEIGDRDWVSLMNRYTQAHGGTPAFIDEPAPEERWTYRCLFKPTADAEQMEFPNPEAGFTPNEHGIPAAPSFGRKKDAKQYAARCCIEWLMKGGYMPSDGTSVEFPKPPRTEMPPPRPRHPPIQDHTLRPPPTTTTTNNTSDPTVTTSDDPSTPTPSTTTATAAGTTPSNPQFFDGWADFGADAIKVPEGLGRVSNVYGRRNARERVAEEVLVWLVAEEARRMVEVEEMMAEVEEMIAQVGEP